MISLDGYTVRKCVQETPRGEIYAGIRDQDGVEVLLKCYYSDRAKDPEARARREYEALRKVQGPGVVRAIDLHLSGERPVLALGWVPGVDLRTLLETRTLEPTEFLEIAVQLAEALARVHEERLIHRDIKPSNVMVDARTLHTTILDFGLALSFGSVDNAADLGMATDGFAGTLLYVAPEQTGRMGRGIDFRSDLYSLGATLYHALSGAPPFEGVDALGLIHAHMARVPPSPLERRPGVPPTLSRIVVKLLQKEPEDRYQTAHALHRDLVEVREQLQRTGRIEDDFPLGTADAPFRPLFTKRLYGRDAEVATLHEAYERVCAGSAELVLLSGQPGIGKSALVHELRRVLAQTSGYLASGKFDLYRRDLPYAAFVAAFESLVQQLLTESEERLALWRERLRAALGNVAAVVVDLVPDLAIIVGEVPSALPLGPKETQARLALAVERFVRACAGRQHPLVLFLDDLQWADAGSRYLLEALLTEGDAEALLVIGAFRDNEMDASHPAMELVARLEQKHVHKTQIEVRPLTGGATTQMLADALGRNVDETRRLAECVTLKTGSSPLLIQQFIHHVHGLGLIRFVRPQGWTWEDAAIAAADIPEGAVGLMMAKLERLEEKARELIRFASCVGDQFDSKLLSELTGQTVPELEPVLFTLAEEGLLAPSASGFRFVHDRIREAAQSLLTPRERSALHYRTGVLLLERTGPEQLPERCFEIADHLNRGIDHLSDDHRADALRVNLAAGRRALSAGAAATSTTYFAFARGLFRETDWERDPKQAFDLFWDAAEAAYQTKSYDVAKRLLDVLEARPLERLRLGQVLGKRMQIVGFNREGDALGATLETLRRFGVRWPRRPSRLRIWWEVFRTDWALRGPLDERIFPRSESGDRSWLAPVLVFRGGGAAMVRESNALACFASAYSLRAQHRYGLARGPGFSLAAYAAFRILALRHPRGAERYARAAVEWMRRLPNAVLDVRGDFELQAYVYAWIRPRRKVLEPLRLVCEAAREVGEIEYLTYAMRNRAVYSVLVGEPLPDVVRDFEAMMERDPTASVVYFFEGYLRAFRMLQNEGGDPWQDVLASVEAESKADDDTANYMWMHWVIALCFLQQYEAASELAERIAEPLFAVGAPGGGLVDFTLFRGFAAVALACQATGAKRRQYLRIYRHCARKLAGWARYNPDFPHMSMFLDAEYARARGDAALALRLYPQAARRAREQGHRHHAALITERRAELLQAKRRETEALMALRDARALYQEWGAQAKVRELRDRDNALRRSARD